MARNKLSKPTVPKTAKKSTVQHKHKDKKRERIPPLGFVASATNRLSGKKAYQNKSYLDQMSNWPDKAEYASFDASTVSCVHEEIEPKTIIKTSKQQNDNSPAQLPLFEMPVENPKFGEAVDFHRHSRNWPARQISGDKQKAFEFANTVFQGDCLDIMGIIPDHSINMVLCDLPYGTTQNKWDSVINLDKLWIQYKRILKPNGLVVLTAQGVFTAKLILSNESWFKYKIVWEKSKPTNFLNVKHQPLRKHEDICVFYRKQPPYNPQMQPGEPYDKGVRKDQFSGSYGDFQPCRVKSNGGRYPTDVLYFKTAESEPGGTVWHPTQKPVDLGRYLIRTFTKPGDIVLDNACGSGSFLVAAYLEGRRFCGIEKNKEVHLFKKEKTDYIKVIVDRLCAYGAKPNVVRR